MVWERNHETTSESVQDLATGLVAMVPQPYGLVPNPQPPSIPPGRTVMEHFGNAGVAGYVNPNGLSSQVRPSAASQIPVVEPHFGSNVGPNPAPVVSQTVASPPGHTGVQDPSGLSPPAASVEGQLGGPQGASLDPMSVVLTGMAQLQSVVQEIASPKASVRPETIKPGVVSLPDLPAHGPESCLAFADWLHASKPALADISDTSEDLWSKTVDEAQAWYSQYLKLDPLSRLTAKPKPSEELVQTKWARVARRIKTMIIAASPQSIKDELNASRTSGLLPLLCRLFIIHGPGSLTERELGLRNIAEPPAGATIQDTIETLRKWQRWCLRMNELGGVLPDSALQVRALSKITKAVLQQNPEIAFRVNLARASLQVDLTPDNEKVQKLHAQLLSELEAIAHRGEKDKDKGNREGPTPPPPKVKGVDAFPGNPSPPPKAPKPPKNPPKAPGSQGQQTSQESSSGKPPCTFHTGHNGCKKGADCTYEHNWAAFSPAEKSARCKTCGAKTHKAAECRAGSKGEDGKPKPKARKAPPNPKSSPEPARGPQPASQPSEANHQHIKSLLADAALLLQQSFPTTTGSGPEQPSATPATPIASPPSSVPGAPKASQPPPVQGTPVTLASLSAQLDQLRSLTREPEVRTCMVGGTHLFATAGVESPFRSWVSS